MVAARHQRRLVVVGKVEATAFPRILQLVDAVGGELLLQLVPEIDKVGAEAEQGLLKVLDVGVEASHPLAGIGDGVAVLQIAERARRGYRETYAKCSDNDRSEPTHVCASSISLGSSPSIARGSSRRKPNMFRLEAEDNGAVDRREKPD
jgi:hypothetical protein